jgi:hypothetical protein
MREMSRVAGNTLAVGSLFVAVIWLILRVTGVFPIRGLLHLPTWIVICTMVTVVLAPAVATLAHSLHWVRRLLVFVLFAASALAIPNFYDQFPILTWVVIAVCYVEVFWVIPKLDRRLYHSAPGRNRLEPDVHS